MIPHQNTLPLKLSSAKEGSESLSSGGGGQPNYQATSMKVGAVYGTGVHVQTDF
jgi:hypothetical protein